MDKWYENTRRLEHNALSSYKMTSFFAFGHSIPSSAVPAHFLFLSPIYRLSAARRHCALWGSIFWRWLWCEFGEVGGGCHAAVWLCFVRCLSYRSPPSHRPLNKHLKELQQLV